MGRYSLYTEDKRMNDYDPLKHDYLNWKDDWDKVPLWLEEDLDRRKKTEDGFVWQDWFNRTHRDNDKPASIEKTLVGNTIQWYQNGKPYRKNDKPNFITKEGDRQWRDNYLLHRDNDRPAWITKSGYKLWYKNGKQYWPIDSIIKSIKFDPRIEVLKLYLVKIIPIADNFEIQDAMVLANPAIISRITNKDVIDKYRGLFDLSELGL